MLGICFILYFLCCVLLFCICHLPKYSESFPCPYLSWGRPTAMDTASLSNKQTKEKNRQSYLYPGGRPRAAYPFPTRLLPIEYFPLPLRNISLPPRKIVHFCHRAGVSSHFIFPWPGLHLLPWVQMTEFFYLERYITYIIFTVQCGTEQRIKGWKSRPLESIWGHQAMSRILCIVYLISVFCICGIRFKENRPDHLSFYSIENV